MKPRLLFEDACRVARDVRELVGYLTSKETVDLGLGLFSAESRAVVPGVVHRYLARLASARSGPSSVTLSIDILAVGMPIGGGDCYARFGRGLIVPGGGSTAVTIEYDWLDRASFILGGACFAPDEFQRAPVGPGSPRMFAIRASLLSGQSRVLDAVTIYQALEG
jgi:hypothetical protein